MLDERGAEVGKAVGLGGREVFLFAGILGQVEQVVPGGVGGGAAMQQLPVAFSEGELAGGSPVQNPLGQR